MLAALPDRRGRISYRVVFDRGYGSANLAISVARGTHCEFVMKCPLNKPSWLFEKYLMPGAAIGTLAVAYKKVDGQIVTAVSYVHEHDDKVVTSNYISNCHGVSARGNVPEVASDYKQNYGYIDVMNHVLEANEFPHRHSSWQGALFDWAVGGVAVNNARIVWNEFIGRNECLKDFTQALASELCPKSLLVVHQPERLPKPRKCIVCRRGTAEKPPKSSTAHFCCPLCYGQPSLHLDCFEAFHDDIDGVTALVQLRNQ